MPQYIKKLAYVLFFAFAWHMTPQALAVSIDDLQVENVSDGDRLVLSMNDPVRLNYEMKTADASPNEDFIVIHLPSGMEWNARTRGQGSGLIRDYVFQSRSGGGGDLFIRTNQRIQVKRDGSNTKGYFLDIMPMNVNSTSSAITNPFISGNTTAISSGEKPLQVVNIRTGTRDDITRIVLDLTVPMQFTIEQSMAGDKLVIKGQEPVEWKGPKRSFQPDGVIQNYRVIGTGMDAYLEVQMESGTAVQRSVIEDSNGKSPKYVIDLMPNNLRSTSLGSLYNNSTSFERDSNIASGAGVSLQPVTSINFEMQAEDTVVTIRMPKALEIPVIDNIYTHQVTISLPKVDWTKVVVPLEATGLIKEYKVDQSLADKTNLILTIDKAAGVIGKRMSVGGAQQGSSLKIMLSTDNAKVPQWLSEITVENLPYDEKEKKEIQTKQIQYRGGVLEFANIGEGLYLTAMGGQVAGVNKLATSKVNYKTDLSPALSGMAGYMGLGYGVQVERGYFGLEALIGRQSITSKAEHTAGSTLSKFKTLTGLTWITSGRIGYYASPVSLVYGKFGVASTTMDINGAGGNGTVLYNSKKHTPRAGFLFGAGVEAAIDDQLSARIETYQTTYQPFKAISATGTNAKFHPKVQEILMGVSWKPSPMGGPSATDAFEDSVASGFYVGGEGGLGSLENNRDVHGTSGNKFKSASLSIEPLWGVYAGYAQNQGRYYLAGEGQIEFNQSKISESRTNSTGNIESYENFLRWSFALTGRAGYIFNHGVIGYGRAGVVASRFSHDGENDTGTSLLTAQKRFAKTVGGLRIGGGLEIFLNPALSLRGDYNVDIYPGVSFKANSGATEKVVATRNEFKLGLAYTLPVNK